VNLNDYDYTTRLRVFAEIADHLLPLFSVRALWPVVCNFLFFLGDTDLSIRNNASYSLTKLVTHIADNLPTSLEHIQFIQNSIFASIRRRVRSSNTLIRGEFILILGKVERKRE
jgi:hypothetical protein